MSKIAIHESRHAQWRRGRELAPPEDLARIPDPELDSLVNVHRMGDEASPQLLEIRMEPNTRIGVHSHDEDEIIYIVEGELRVGDKALDPGSSLFVAGGAFYSFTAGPEGVRFLNFRPRRDLTYNVKSGRR
jgi:quercetin dioxygenase-like cupin family protein